MKEHAAWRHVQVSRNREVKSFVATHVQAQMLDTCDVAEIRISWQCKPRRDDPSR